MPRIDVDVRRRLVADAPVARLATVTADGRAHVVPCCFVLIDDAIYSVVDAKPKATGALKRLDNVRATATASLVVDHYEDDWNQLWWVRVDGDALVLEPGQENSVEYELALERLREKYHQYRTQPPRGAVLRIAITGWRDWTAGDQPSVER